MSTSEINCLVFIEIDILNNFLKKNINTENDCITKITQKNSNSQNFFFSLKNTHLSLNLYKEDGTYTEIDDKKLQQGLYYYYDTIINIHFYGFADLNRRYDYYFSSSLKEIGCFYKDNEVTILRGVKKGSLFSDSFFQQNQAQLENQYLTFTKKKENRNYLPPYAFLKHKTHQLIILDSILQTIIIKQIQEKTLKEPITIKVAIVSHPNQLRCFAEKYLKSTDYTKRLGGEYDEYFRRLYGIKLSIKTEKTEITFFSQNYENGNQTKDVNTMKYAILTKGIIDWSILGCDLEIFIFNQGESYDKKRTHNLIFDTKLIDGQIAKLKELKQKKYHQMRKNEQNEEPVLTLKEYSNSSEETSSVLQIFNFNNDFDYYFTSSLLRSRETFEALFPNKKEVIILPCAQEISYFKEACYKKNQKTIFKAPENIVNDFRSNLPSDLRMDWSFYNNSSCPEGSNLIEEMVKIIFYKKIEEEKQFQYYKSFYDKELQEFPKYFSKSDMIQKILIESDKYSFDEKDFNEFINYLIHKIISEDLDIYEKQKMEIDIYIHLYILQKLFETKKDVSLKLFISVIPVSDAFKVISIDKLMRLQTLLNDTKDINKFFKFTYEEEIFEELRLKVENLIDKYRIESYPPPNILSEFIDVELFKTVIDIINNNYNDYIDISVNFSYNLKFKLKLDLEKNSNIDINDIGLDKVLTFLYIISVSCNILFILYTEDHQMPTVNNFFINSKLKLILNSKRLLSNDLYDFVTAMVNISNELVEIKDFEIGEKFLKNIKFITYVINEANINETTLDSFMGRAMLSYTDENYNITYNYFSENLIEDKISEILTTNPNER